MAKIKNIGGEVPTNGAKEILESGFPYQAEVKLQGVSDLLFHRWNCEAIEAQSNSTKKGSKAKKHDNLESYVYRNENNQICIPGEYLRMSIVNAAKFKQDPRSPRKSAMDLYKAGIVCLNIYAALGTETWDYEDRRRAVIQRNGINRIRPAMKAGWQASFDLMVNLPEYISPDDLNEIIQLAGRLIGVGDQRPTYGRFQIIEFKVKSENETSLAC